MAENDNQDKALDDSSPKRGRPKLTPPMRLKEAFQLHGQEALTRLLQLMRQSEDARVTLAATQEILNRGYGRPSQAVEITQSFHEDVIDQLRMVQDRTLQAARMAAEAAAVGEDDQRQSEILDVVQDDGATIIEMSAISKA